MPTRYAQPQPWRQRRAATTKKYAIEAEMVMESEIVTLKEKPMVAPTSPTTIASIFDIPELKPMTLPGAWTVVGKGGKPIKADQKMYDPPKKKKRTRTRTRKPEIDAEELLEALEEASSSKCVQKLRRSSAQSEMAMRGRNEKQWKRYREAKKMRILARDELVAALDGEENPPHANPKLPKKLHNKADSNKEKCRREAKLAARDARCYSLEGFEEPPRAEEPPTQPRLKQKPVTSSADATAADKGASATAKATTPPLEKQKSKNTFKKNCSIM